MPASGQPLKSRGIKLAWTAPDGAVKFHLWRGISSCGEGAKPYMMGITSTSYVDSSVTDGTTYYYEVTAVDAGGEGADSSQVHAKAE